MAGARFQAVRIHPLSSCTPSCRTAHTAGCATAAALHRISKRRQRPTSSAAPVPSIGNNAGYNTASSSVMCNSTNRGSASTSRGRSRGPAGREAPPRHSETLSGRDADTGSYRPQSSRPRPTPTPSDDFVVIGKAESGTYIHSAKDLSEREGGAFWASAIGADEYEEDDDDDVSDSEDQEILQGVEEGKDEVEIEEITTLLRDLAEGLDGDETESPHQALWRQIYTSTETPELYLGPVAVKTFQGKGRGLICTEALNAGDLIMVADPLAILYCKEGTTPEIEDLADHITTAAAAAAAAGGGAAAAALAPWQQHALLQLRPPGSAAAAAADVDRLPDLLHLLGDPSDVASGLKHWAAAAAAAAGSSDGGHQQQQQQQQQRLDVPEMPNAVQDALPGSEDILNLAFANCTGEESDDPSLVLLRGSHSSGHLGIWPAAAMINHSCCPNTHTLLIGDKLVVRAAVDIPSGQELSLSYLGPQLFAPAAVRQQELQQQWEFHCSCNRCKAEARYAGSSTGSSSSSTSLSQLLLQTHTTCKALSQDLDIAIENDNMTLVQQIQQNLLSLRQQIDTGIRSVKPPANVRRWLQASVYDLYDLISLCADQLPAAAAAPARSRSGQRDRDSAAAAAVETEALAMCARILGSVLPGSSGHVDLATEYMVRTEARFGDDHQEAVDAQRLCSAAHIARYGQCSQGMLQLLVDTRAGAALL